MRQRLQKEEVWSKVGHTDRARQVLGSELIRALDAPLATHLNDEGSNEHDSKMQSAQALKDRHSLQADLTGGSSCLLSPICVAHSEVPDFGGGGVPMTSGCLTLA